MRDAKGPKRNAANFATSRRGKYAEIFEFVRRQNEAPAAKPMRYSFEPARRPDMMLARRPETGIRAADLALTEIREYATKARDLYRERRRNDRPAEAHDFVRHQLALGLLDVPSRKPIDGNYRFEDLNQRMAPTEKTQKAKSRWRFLRRRQRED
jgi:hypothetical protein